MKKLFSVVTLAIFAMSVYGQILSVEDINLEKNTQKVVAVSLNNPKKGLTALQFDFVVPNGISIAVDETSLNPSRIVDHQLFVKQRDNHTYRFLVFSETNADFIGSEGDMIYIPLVTGDIPDGTLAGSLEKQLVCASDAQPDYMANVKIDVKVSTTQSLSFGASGLLTCVSKFDIDFSEFEDVKAYIATGFDIATNELWLTNVTDVPAGTPIFVTGPAHETIHVPLISAITCYPENFLKGSATEATEVSAATGEYQNWVLEEDGQFGKVAENMTLEAGKAYLQQPKTFISQLAESPSVSHTMKSDKETFVSMYDLDFTDVEGMNVYTVTGFARGGDVWLTPVNKVPAGTAMLLVGQNGVSYSIPSTGMQMVYADMLKGDAKNKVDLKTVDSGLSIYIMNKDKFTYLSAWAVSMMGTYQKGFVYLTVPIEYGVDSVTKDGYNTSMVDAEVISMKLDSNRTAINGVKASRKKDEGVWYNLQGQRVENPRKGLYILDGKKKALK